MTHTFRRVPILGLASVAALAAFSGGQALAADVVVIPPPVAPVVVDIPPAHRFYIDVDLLYMTRSNPAQAALVTDGGDPVFLDAEDFDFGWDFGVEARAGFVSGGGIGVEIGGFFIAPFMARAGAILDDIVDLETTPVTDEYFAQEIIANNATWMWGADANVTFSPSTMLMVLGGVAYVNIFDFMRIQIAQGAGNDLYFDWGANNRLIGPQLGARLMLGDPNGLTFTIEGRGAYLFNAATVLLNANKNDIGQGVLTGTATETVNTWMIAGKASVGWQLSERINIHASYQAMWFNNLALAPAQVTGTGNLGAAATDPVTITPQYGALLVHGAGLGFSLTF